MRCASLFLAIVCAGCGGIGRGGSGDPWAGGVTRLAGLAAFDSGLVQVTVMLASPYAGPTSTGGVAGSASAQLVTAGASTSLSGTFDPASRQLTLSGGGYSINATADATSMSGFANSATGPGAFAVEPNMPSVLCGSFQGSLSGSLGLVVEPGGQATLLYAVASAQSRSTVETTVSGGRIATAAAITFNGHNLMIDGTVGATSGQGTWSDTATTTGTWSAGACN
jgi:hypothetical protein